MDPIRDASFKAQEEKTLNEIQSSSSNIPISSDTEMTHPLDATIQQTSQQLMSQNADNQQQAQPLIEKQIKEINAKQTSQPEIVIELSKIIKYLFPGKAEIKNKELLDLTLQSALLAEVEEVRKKDPHYIFSEEEMPSIFIKLPNSKCYRYSLEFVNDELQIKPPTFLHEKIANADIKTYTNPLDLNKILHHVKRRGNESLGTQYDPDLQSTRIQDFINSNRDAWTKAAEQNPHKKHLVRHKDSLKLSSALPPIHSILVDASGTVNLRYKRSGVKQSGLFKKLRLGIEYDTGKTFAWTTFRFIPTEAMEGYTPKIVEEFGKLIEFHPAFNKLYSFQKDESSTKNSEVTASYLFTCDAFDAVAVHKINPLKDKKFLLRLLLGLQFIHESGWAHCDIKPENLLVEINPQTKKVARVVFHDYETVVKINGEGFCKRVTAEYTRPELLPKDPRSKDPKLNLPMETAPLITAPLGDLYALAKSIYILYKGALLANKNEERWLMRAPMNYYGSPILEDERSFLILLYNEFHTDKSRRSQSVAEFIEKLIATGFVNEKMLNDEKDLIRESLTKARRQQLPQEG